MKDCRSVDAVDSLIHDRRLRYRDSVFLGILFAYWAILGIGRVILDAMFDLEFRRGTVNDLGISITPSVLISPDVLTLLGSVVFITIMIFRSRTQFKRQNILWKLLISVIMTGPIIMNLGIYLFCPKPKMDTYEWLWFGPYLVNGTPGAVGACLGWISTLFLFPAILIAFRISNGRWPTYSVMSLVVFVFAFSGTVVWSLEYLRLFERTEWFLR